MSNVLCIQCALVGGLGNTHYHQGGAITSCGPFTPLFTLLTGLEYTFNIFVITMGFLSLYIDKITSNMYHKMSLREVHCYLSRSGYTLYEVLQFILSICWFHISFIILVAFKNEIRLFLIFN